MLRREFLSSFALSLVAPAAAVDRGRRLADAASAQLTITHSYDPSYRRITYPNGDVPRTTGVCADVIVRAARDGLSLDLQRLVHEDMQRDFTAYPSQKMWGLHQPDANIDHRRVPNLEIFWLRAGGRLWTASQSTNGDDFPSTLLPGDFLTWRLDARLPHVGVVVGHSFWGPQIVHNIGRGVEQISLMQMRSQRAFGHYRWPAA
jgi:uncharacterized protein YijF (DUF1287 family)